MNRRSARPSAQMVRQMATLIASTTMLPKTLAVIIAKNVAENPPTAKQINNVVNGSGSGAQAASALSRLWSSAGTLYGGVRNTAGTLYGGVRGTVGGFWKLGQIGKDTAVVSGYGIQIWVMIAIIMLIMGSIYKIALMRKKAKAINTMQNVSGTVATVARTAVNLAQTGANIAKRSANIVVSRSEKLSAILEQLEAKLYNPNQVLSNIETANLQKKIEHLQREIGAALQDCGAMVDRLQNGASRVLGGNGGAGLIMTTARTTAFILGESRREAANLNKPGAIQKAITGAGQAVGAAAAVGASGGGLLLMAAAGAAAGASARQASPPRLTNARRQASPPRLTNARRQTSPRRLTNARRQTSPRRLTNARRQTSPPRLTNARRQASPPRRRSPNNNRNSNNALKKLLKQVN